VTAHRPGLGPTFAPPVQGIRAIKALSIPRMPHTANAG